MSVVWCLQGMLPVRHLAPNSIMAVNYCGLQLARMLGWAASAYHEKKYAALHSVARKHGM